MKTTYRPFSAHPFLVAIALFSVLTLLNMLGWGAAMLLRSSVNYTTADSLFFVGALLVVLLLNYWFLRISVLPVVKMNAEGITAWSLFWKRALLWPDVRTARLVKVSNRYHVHGTIVSLEETKVPESKRIAVLNKGVTVSTFIVIAAKAWQKPRDVVAKSLDDHDLVAGRHAIAFEYDEACWKMINEKLGRK